MATIPLSGTNIRLLSGVPFHSDYKHTRWFDSKTDQTNYFLAKPVVHSISEANFQRVEGKTFIRVDQSIDQLRFTNYLMFQNAHYSNKWFYGFVTHLEYKQKNLTFVHFEIDVFQTWRFDMTFKPSFVVREHRPLWNSDGSPVVNTVDEGLNYGTDYQVKKVEHVQAHNGVFFLVIVSKEVMHGIGVNGETVIKPMINGAPQPLTYYVHPFKLNGTSPIVNMSGTNVAVSSVNDVLKNICMIDDAVNNVVAIYVTEYFGFNTNYIEETNTLFLNTSNFEHALIQDTELNVNTFYVKDLKSYSTLSKDLGNKWSGYDVVKESKLLMYPYCVTILDDLKGNRVVIKNEYIQTNNLKINMKGSLGTSNKVSYHVRDYLVSDDALFGTNVALEHALISNNPNDLPILNDFLSAYLQGNRNSLEIQKQSIFFNGMLNMASSFVGGASSAMQLNPFGTIGGAVDVVKGGGNAVLQLQAIEAKQQDVNNTPATLAKMGGNTAFDYGNGLTGLYVIKKQITKEYQDKLTDFFNMFGYKTNELKIPNFHTRRYWNYVETKSCMIAGNFNNEDLQELKNVFDNGITLWHTDDIGNYSLVNEVI